jgi:hypothetical protein
MFRWLKKHAQSRAAAPVVPARLPPVPDWRPDIVQPLDRLVERLRAYTDDRRDLALFGHGTAVLLPDGLDDAAADDFARRELYAVFHGNPDMNPVPMLDGNLLVRYGDRVANVVLADIAALHRAAIDDNHLRALATGEVLLTPQGANLFDDFGKQALFGRCYLFMDAQAPKVERIVRAAVPS